MKTWTLRFRAVDKKNFEALREGHKSVETRAATPKYQKIQAGDHIIVTCGSEKVEKKVAKVAIYPSIDALFVAIPLELVMPFATSITEAEKEYYSYPGYKEKIAEFGLLAFT